MKKPIVIKRKHKYLLISILATILCTLLIINVAQVLAEENQTAEEQFEDAKQLYYQDSIEEAISKLQGIVDKYPRSKVAIKAQYLMGLIYRDKNPQKAIKTFAALVADFPDTYLASPAQFMIGGCYQNLRRPQKAIAAYREVIRQFPNSEEAPDAQLRIGDILEFELRNYKQAVKEYQSFIRNYSKNRGVWRALTRIEYIYVKKLKDIREAITIYQKFITDYPDNKYIVRAQYEIGWLYIYLGNTHYAQATKEFQKVIDHFPKTEFKKDAQDNIELIKKGEMKIVTKQVIPKHWDLYTLKQTGEYYLSPKGTILIDHKTNSLIIDDYLPMATAIEHMLNQIDSIE